MGYFKREHFLHCLLGIGVAQFCFCLSFKLRVRVLYGYNCNYTVTDVLAVKDPRRAIQIPKKVYDAGLEKNPR